MGATPPSSISPASSAAGRFFFLLLLSLLSLLLDPALATMPPNGLDDTPQPISPSGSGSGDGASSGSSDIIGGQPATVQLGSGFIVGCVIGVILYTVVKLSMRIVRSTLAERRRSRGEGGSNNTMGEGLLIEV